MAITIYSGMFTNLNIYLTLYFVFSYHVHFFFFFGLSVYSCVRKIQVKVLHYTLIVLSEYVPVNK